MPIDVEEYGIQEQDGEYVSKSNLLKADMIGKAGKTVNVRILSAEEREYQNIKKMCIKLSIPDIDKEEVDMVLNKTNLKALLNEFGNDETQWVNKELNLHVERVDFNGKQVAALRLYPI